MNKNTDKKVVKDFGKEWSTYKQNISLKDLKESYDQYFSLLPEKYLNKNSVGFDAGCGSGRWAKFIVPKVKHLYCLDASKEALKVAKNNLASFENCSFELNSINSSNIKKDSMDFGYCLGVLHHLPNTAEALNCCVSKLKKGAPFLLYIYYSLDNKPLWFKWIWKFVDIKRKVICRLPFPIKFALTRLIALIIYFPLSRLSLFLEKFGFKVSNIPLSDYRKKSLYFMYTDALDRFGTKLEKRFSKEEITKMMNESGLCKIVFSNSMPYWVALGYRK